MENYNDEVFHQVVVVDLKMSCLMLCAFIESRIKYDNNSHDVTLSLGISDCFTVEKTRSHGEIILMQHKMFPFFSQISRFSITGLSYF